jgi:hypothetical protein
VAQGVGPEFKPQYCKQKKKRKKRKYFHFFPGHKYHSFLSWLFLEIILLHKEGRVGRPGVIVGDMGRYGQI